eukprot:3269826-Alexandrium_andersonii.AAC.1
MRWAAHGYVHGGASVRPQLSGGATGKQAELGTLEWGPGVGWETARALESLQRSRPWPQIAPTH